MSRTFFNLLINILKFSRTAEQGANMELTLDIGSTLQHLPTTASLVASFVILILGLWLKIKKSDVEEKKNESDIQIAQVDSLMQQIKLLSDELDRTRKQLTDLHLQNLELMEQLREANKRIGELERALAHTPCNKDELGHCPNRLAG